MDAVVETRFGRVRGKAQHGVLCFRGIPYARAAEGPLRFARPLPPEPWPGVRECAEPGPGAPQRSALPGWLAGIAGNPRETGLDCLRLHVATPSPDATKRPVLVWVHGGGFVFGAGGSPIYRASRLARAHDVVVVALNYRLGVLGFGQLASLVRDERFAWNAGLEDQLLALAWVREHAAAFGGDPANVTVFGESAGAMSIGALLGMPGARERFARAICQSGAAHHCSSAEGAARRAHAFLRALDLSPARAGELLEAPLEVLLAAQARAAASAPLPFGLLPWQPAVDGERLPVAPLEAIANGSARGVELLIGTNRDEYNLFLLSRAVRRMDEARLATVTERVLGPAHAPAALALYRALRPSAPPVERWSTLQTHRVFRAPAERLAALQARHAPVFSYLFTWSSPLAPRIVGACHALEIPLVFDTWRRPALRLVYAGGRARRARDAGELGRVRAQREARRSALERAARGRRALRAGPARRAGAGGARADARLLGRPGSRAARARGRAHHLLIGGANRLGVARVVLEERHAASSRCGRRARSRARARPSRGRRGRRRASLIERFSTMRRRLDSRCRNAQPLRSASACAERKQAERGETVDLLRDRRHARSSSGCARAVAELQELHDHLDVEEPAAPGLEVAPLAALVRQLALHAQADAVDLAGRALGQRPRQDLPAQRARSAPPGRRLPPTGRARSSACRSHTCALAAW